VTVYLDGLYQQGAFKGTTPEQAYYVKCDEEINTLAVREAGMVVTEVGLAAAAPSEFIVARIVHGASGVTITSSET
jgi:phage tail sheath protein FI